MSDETENKPIENLMPATGSAHWSIRLGAVILALSLWFWTQHLIGDREESDKIFDFIHNLTEPINKYLSQNADVSNGLLILSSLCIDALGLFLLGSGIFGKSIRPFLALIGVFTLRQLCQGLNALPPPENMIWHKTGFPSLLVTYGVSTDLFFSGHTSIAVLGAYELSRYKKKWLTSIGVFVAIFEIVTVLILRAHYTMDVYTGLVTALLIAGFASQIAPFVDRVLGKLGKST